MMISDTYNKPGLDRHKISKIYAIFLLPFFFICCGEGPPDRIVKPDRQFRTTPPSRIYFKNIRSTAYQWQQDPESRTEYYLLRKLADANDLPLLYPVIADVWIEDQAHIILKSDQYDDLPTPISLSWSTPTGRDSLRIDTINERQQYQLAMKIYQAIQKGFPLEIRFSDGKKQAFLADPKERNLFLIIMQDFLRLTDNY